MEDITLDQVLHVSAEGFTRGFEAGVKAEQDRIMLIVAGLVRCDGTGVDTVRRDDVLRKIQSRHTQLGQSQDPIATRRSV